MATLTTFTANTQIKSAEVNANFTGLSDGTMDIDHNSLQVFRDEALFDFVNSGGVWSGDSYAVNRNASMTALVTTIDGWRSSIGAVTSRTFTASKDTYIDVLRSGTTSTLVYTEVSNNAASPALASNSLRLGIIVTGASTIANVGSVNQGEFNKVLPVASSIAYSVTDSLGNLICNRSARPTIIGYRQITGNVTTTSATPAQATGLAVPVIGPTGRKVKLTVAGRTLENNNTAGFGGLSIWSGVVGSGTQLARSYHAGAVSTGITPATAVGVDTPGGSVTYNVGIEALVAGTTTLSATSTEPAALIVELA